MLNKTLIGKKRVRMKERNSAFWESGEGGEKYGRKYPSSLARTRVLFCENLYCLCILGVKCFIIRWLTRESNAHLLSNYLRLLLRQVVSLICLIYMWFYVLWSDFIEKSKKSGRKIGFKVFQGVLIFRGLGGRENLPSRLSESDALCVQ